MVELGIRTNCGDCRQLRFHLMSRKMSRVFIDYWENVVDNFPTDPIKPLSNE
jgi:hypothetical protein